MDDVRGLIKNVLVAADFSETSNFAIARAIEIAKLSNANLTILHITQRDFFDKILETIIPAKNLKTPKESATDLILEKIAALSDHKINIYYDIISAGKPSVKILQYIKKNKVDFLVMGAHGQYSIRDGFVGTTTEYLAKKTPCPLLITKRPANKPFKKILVPIDFSSVNKKALNYAQQLFPNAKINLLHVGDFEYEELLKRARKEELLSKVKIKTRKAILLDLENKIKKFINEYDIHLAKTPCTIKIGYPGPTIIKEAAKLKSDLIIMGTQGNGLEHPLPIGSTANWVLTETEKDILFIPN